MEVHVYRFSVEQFKKIPSRYAGFCVASGHFCNEFAILMPYFVFEHSLKETNEVEAAFIVMRRYTIQRTLISKIVEYHELCSRFFTSPSAEADSEFRELYEPISKQIKSAKWARILRNKISFHFDQQHAEQGLEKLGSGHPLRLIAGGTKGLTVAEFAEEIIGRPIFEAAGDGDIAKGMEAISTFLVSLGGLIMTFNSSLTTTLFKKYNVALKRETFPLRAQYCGVPGEMRIPLSPTLAYLEARRIAKSKTARRAD